MDGSVVGRRRMRVREDGNVAATQVACACNGNGENRQDFDLDFTSPRHQQQHQIYRALLQRNMREALWATITTIQEGLKSENIIQSI